MRHSLKNWIRAVSSQLTIVVKAANIGKSLGQWNFGGISNEGYVIVRNAQRAKLDNFVAAFENLKKAHGQTLYFLNRNIIGGI